MRIAALIILYHPNEIVNENIASFIDLVEKVYVFDNTEKEKKTKNIITIKSNKIVLFQDGENKGIAERLNTGLEQALIDGYEWLLTMDQDSSFSSNYIEKYFKNVSMFNKVESVAIFGVNDNRKAVPSIEYDEFEEIDTLITSGSLLNLNLANEIGYFDEKLFIDSVDNDYCIRAKLLGFRIIKFKNILMVHQLGNSVHKASIKSLFILKKHKEIHTPIRCYYILRNNLYLQDKFKSQNIALIEKLSNETYNHIKKCILYGGSFFKYCKYLRKAKKDFKAGSMGKINY